MKIVRAITLMLAMSVPASASWLTGSRVDPADDSVIKWIAVRAEAPYINRYGRLGIAELTIQCEANTTLLVLRLPELYTSDLGSLGNATFRVDSKPAGRVNMIASNDHTSLALRGGAAIRVIKQMIGGKRMLARVITVNEPHKDIYFQIAGIDQSIGPVRKSCGW